MPEPTPIRAGERICPDCKGRGRSWWKVPGGRSVEMSCDTCHGSGKLKPVRSAECGVRSEKKARSGT